MATNTRPGTLTTVHNYNLRNQGWPRTFSCAIDDDGDEKPIQTDPVAHTQTILGIYPSNADVIYANRMATAQHGATLGAYGPWLLTQSVFGNTPAAKGHYIINAFDRNRQSVSGLNGIYDPSRDQEEFRPISVAFYSGRTWYLMADGRVYFSQVLTEIENASKCYQEADPTAEDINALVATDGGFIDIVGISQGLKLIPVGNSLAILADNGVWSISGSGEESFSAISQEIRKISDTGVIGTDSVLSADGIILYWSEGGIYALTANEVTGFLEAQNITQQNIQTFYLNISEIAKTNARGFYDKQSRKIFWFYNDLSGYDGTNKKNRYNRVLIFDIVLQAFYHYVLSTSADTDPYIATAIQKSPGSFATSTELVTSGGATVTSGGEDVTAEITTENTSEVKLKFLTFVETSSGTWQYTFSELLDDRMVDFFSEDQAGTAYTSFLETGYDTLGDLIAEKEANTIYMFFKLTEKAIIDNGLGGLDFDKPSSCLVRAKWQWADSDTSGQWSDQEQAYRLQRLYVPTGIGPFEYGNEVVQTINQVRGRGRSLLLRFDSETGKDFHLLGWATPFTAITGA